ncbi:FadR/GntR family transcriptional regulator [Streptomyces purpurogeneiscleroticus]|uniref:FadR/GntR family transcriptional regulator n=1 Tax=Streptomyces purpurogeneiscleroticus TaxID=68259 RepID=UPI001CBC9730|nr:FadR/GntR family transcriptional regulator [Streptomyces purpurogeneiscleroticus]MBZ4019541.1 GntR family transcriptional regulator [Streptomyces purpurogeneiscleroticus]
MARGTMSEDVQAQIKRLILRRKLVPGDPLPTEAELVELLDVSRNSVREALKALQAMRIVEIRHGFGTYVGTLTLDPFVEGVAFRAAVRHHQGEASLYELMEVREALEAGLVGSVARNLPADDLAVLRGLVDRMEKEAAAGRVESGTDRAFHLALYRSLGNHLLSEVLDAFWDALRRVRKDLDDSRSDPEVTWRQHAEIVTALETGDGDRAVEAMHRHFDGIRERQKGAV